VLAQGQSHCIVRLIHLLPFSSNGSPSALGHPSTAFSRVWLDSIRLALGRACTPRLEHRRPSTRSSSLSHPLLPTQPNTKATGIQGSRCSVRQSRGSEACEWWRGIGASAARPVEFHRPHPLPKRTPVHAALQTTTTTSKPTLYPAPVPALAGTDSPLTSTHTVVGNIRRSILPKPVLVE
jgi:hypothetical protein